MIKFVLYIALIFVCCSRLCGQVQACPPTSSHITVGAGSYSSRPGVTYHLHQFSATLVPMGTRAPACYQKMTVVSRAEIFISNESLTKVFGEKLATSNSKIKNFNIQNGNGTSKLTGQITKLIPIDFTVEGPVTTDGSAILLTATKIKADGIPLKALLGLIGQHLNSVLALKGMNGIAVTNDVLSFFPEQVAHLKGHIDSVEATPQGLMLRMSKSHDSAYTPAAKRNPPVASEANAKHLTPAASKSDH